MAATSLHAAVLSDTHLARGIDGLSFEAMEHLETADVILHAGDVTSPQVLGELARFAPTHAVLGNNDHELVGRLPERRELTLAGVNVAMVHDSGAKKGRAARMKRWFPKADLVVFGHSHDPVDETGVEGQWLFNPGSPTQRRRQPHHTIGLLGLADGQVTDHAVVPV